jgi:hypothetical protein
MGPRARDQRKADLLVASALLRSHAAGAVHDLAGTADTVALRVRQVRAWLAVPYVRHAGAVLTLWVTVRRWHRGRMRAPRPHRVARLMASLGLIWRLGRWAAPWLAACRRPRTRYNIDGNAWR